MNYQNLTKKIHPEWKPFFDQTKKMKLKKF